MPKGIDISNHQTVSSWSTLASEIDFLFIKATEGATYRSPTFVNWFKAAKNAGLLVGSYHFASPDGSDAVLEADNYIKALKDAGFKPGLDLPPVLDIEVNGANFSKAALTTWCQTFMSHVDSAFNLPAGRKTGFYCNRNYYNNEIDGAGLRSGRWLWLAWWPNNNNPPWPSGSQIPSDTTVWQFTDDGNKRINGISGTSAHSLDLNIAYESALKKLAPTYFAGKDDGMPAPIDDYVNALLNETITLDNGNQTKLVDLLRNLRSLGYEGYKARSESQARDAQLNQKLVELKSKIENLDVGQLDTLDSYVDALLQTGITLDNGNSTSFVELLKSARGLAFNAYSARSESQDRDAALNTALNGLIADVQALGLTTEELESVVSQAVEQALKTHGVDVNISINGAQ